MSIADHDITEGEVIEDEAHLPAIRQAAPMTSYRAAFAMELTDLAEQFTAMDRFKHTMMRPGVDFMKIPGTPKESLLKPGAERLLMLFGFGHHFDKPEVDRDENGKPWGVTTRCIVTRSMDDGREVTVSSCDAYASKDEPKWKTAPWNTILKMAQKRALVGAALTATGSSDFFTQDVEDYEPVAPRDAGSSRFETPPPAPEWLIGTPAGDKVLEAIKESAMTDVEIERMVEIATTDRTAKLSEVRYDEFPALKRAKAVVLGQRVTADHGGATAHHGGEPAVPAGGADAASPGDAPAPGEVSSSASPGTVWRGRTPAQHRRLMAECKGMTRDARLAWSSRLVGREVTTWSEDGLSCDEAKVLIDAHADAAAQQPTLGDAS